MTDTVDRAWVAARSGLEAMRAMLDGAMPLPPMARTMNFRAVEVAEGRIVFEGSPTEAHANPFGPTHGGWYGAILDTCMACAINTLLPQGTGYTTLEYKVNIVRGVPIGGEAALAEGTAQHVGRRTGVADGRLVGADSGKLYATGSTTCLIFSLE